MDTSQLRELSQQHYYTILLIQAGIGLVLGLIPLIISIKKGRRNLGVIALITSIVLSLLSPILSIIAVVVFIVLILRKPAA